MEFTHSFRSRSIRILIYRIKLDYIIYGGIKVKQIIILIMICLLSNSAGFADSNIETVVETEKADKVDEYISENFNKLKVPGLSVGLIINGKKYYLNYGVSDIGTNKKVTNKTNYELASVSKSFTGLAVAKLIDEGKLGLDDNVSKYISGFHGLFSNEKHEITIENLLYHTSGIGVETIRLYREDNSEEALLNISKTVSGTNLNSLPGSTFEYATINYAVLGAVIEVVTGEQYIDYIKENILNELNMNNSYAGYKENDKELSKGYKISFFKPREYIPPRFRNNDPSGYIISNIEDMLKYLDYQLGNVNNNLYNIRKITHEPNTNVALAGDSFYSYGWFNILNGFNEINHGGNNPNFTSWMSFNEGKNSGIVILANSNSANMQELANNIGLFLYGGTLSDLDLSAGGMDNVLGAFTILFGIIILILIGLCIFIGYEYKKGKRTLGFKQGAVKKLIIYILASLPLVYGIYLLPKVFGDLDWYTARLWSSESLFTCVISIITSIILSYITYFILLLFPTKNDYLKEAPELILLGLLSGLSNAIVIFLVTSSLNGEGNIIYILYYFLTALFMYVAARRTLEVKLAELSQLIIKNIREKIFEKLFSANLEEFEGMNEGQIIATITNDINQIGGLAGLIIVFITSIITTIAAFIYLGTVSAWGTLVVIGVIIAAGGLFAYLNYIATTYLDIARETQNEFLSKVEALIGGFKDLVLHNNKKKEYQSEVTEINKEFVYNNVKAFRTFVNAFMVGESIFIVVLGTIAFGFTFIFAGFGREELTTFVMVLIYLLGPINGIINAFPRAMQIKIAIDRVRQLLLQLPPDSEEKNGELEKNSSIETLETEGVLFQYESIGLDSGFKVGPIDLKVEKGEILFIIGGNGSGKSTLIKLLSGLYDLHGGSIKINGREINSEEVGENISAVFADSFMFDRVYDVDLTNKEKVINDYLRILELDDKVELIDGMFTTISLSTGQRKRLHLLRCILEDKPIYVFDELAADQDPQFRNFFYRTMLPQMKEAGKIIIAVTHDDHYFDVADRVLKLDCGQIDDITADSLISYKGKVS